MKKILSLLLVTVAIVSLFGLTAFADTEYYVLRNLESKDVVPRIGFKGGSFNCQWSAILQNGKSVSGDNVAFELTIEQVNDVLHYTESVLLKEGETIKAKRIYTGKSTGDYLTTPSPEDPASTVKIATFYNVTAGTFQQAIDFFFRTPTCDGSSCSWADANLDGVCDTCAKSLRMYPYQSIEEYAHVHLNTAVNNLYPDDKYWLFYTTEEGADVDVYILSSPVPFVYDVAKGVQASTSSSFHKSSVTLMSVTNGVPQYGGTGWSTTDNTKFDGIVINPYKVVDSSHTIEGFFPIPLHQIIQGVTEGTITTTIPTIGGTISVLIISGIGLMALLIAFLLLVKALRRYLKK